MTIGQRIAELRKQQGLSQEALGELLGVSRQAISKWESDAALPEIDKLIALSKRFGVTVGYLLGVEEETTKSEAPEGEQGPTEAEVLERYLNTLPKRRAISKKWVVLIAIILSIFFFSLLHYIDGLEGRIGSLSNTVNDLTYQMSNVQDKLYGISDDISTKIDEALKQEYGLLANWKMELVELNYGEGTALIELNAVLKSKFEDGDTLRFYAQLQDGSYVMEEDSGTWNSQTNSYTARLTLPMTQSDIEYYLTTPGGTVCLASDLSHELCNLRYGTQLEVWCTVFNHSERADLQGSVTLDISPPWMLTKTNSDLGELGEPTVELWLVHNGERMLQLTPVLEHDLDDIRIYYSDINVSSDSLDPAPKEGDQLWVEYEVSYGNGLTAAGEGDELWIFTQWGFWERSGVVTVVD